MHTNFADRPSTAYDAIFSALRAKLCHEVSGSAMLAALLEKVNGMQEAYTRPADFKDRFDEFVARAADDLEIVRPFFPMFVQFMPAHRASESACEPQRDVRVGQDQDLTSDAA